jgi:hypothetical protein
MFVSWGDVSYRYRIGRLREVASVSVNKNARLCTGNPGRS